MSNGLRHQHVARIVAVNADDTARLSCGHVVRVDWETFLRSDAFDPKLPIYVTECRYCAAQQEGAHAK